MARRRRTDLEVQKVKSSILEAALNLFDRHDYNELSMRTIAKAANCSVATIYNYYSSKDTLYMDVLKSGFQLLHRSLTAEGLNPPNSIKALCRRFFDFAVQHQHYYNLMFSSPFPKTPDNPEACSDKAALEEREGVIKSLDSFTGIIRSCMEEGELKYAVAPELLAKMLWAVSHGVITLYNSRIIQAMGEEPDKAFDNIIDNFVDCLEEKC